MNSQESAIRVELFERRVLPPPTAEQVERVSRRLEALERRGEIDAVERSEWPSRTPVEDCEAELRRRYLSFCAWADREEVRLAPFFGVRECFQPGERERADWLVLPALCLAAYADDQLRAVYPHADGPETLTVTDALGRLGGEPGQRAEESPRPAD